MMQCGMMGGVMKRHVLATSDGGVVVVAGDRLFKYDEDMQQMMKNMRKHCGMCRKLCQQEIADEDAAEAGEEAEDADE